MSERVVILDDYQEVALNSADWTEVARRAQLVALQRHLASPDELVAELRDATVAIAMRERTPFPRSVLERLPSLRLLVTAGMRNASIDKEAAREAGIMVCGTGSGGFATAELTWGLILGLLRNIPVEYQAVLAGKWQGRLGDTVRGKVLGIIGLGRLGSLVADVGRAFGMEILAWSERLTDERAAECGATRVTHLQELMARADVVTVHTVLSRRTRGMITAEVLSHLRPTAIFVNTSRAQIVDQEALLQLLETHAIRGAAIDVFDVEPLPVDSRFRRLDNVILTPHMGHVTIDNYRAFYGDAVEDILGFWEQRPVRVLNGIEA